MYLHTELKIQFKLNVTTTTSICRSQTNRNIFKRLFKAPVYAFDIYIPCSVTRKKSPKVYKSCPKMISLEKLKILTPLQKLPKNGGDWGKLIVAKGLKKLPKVQ